MSVPESTFDIRTFLIGLRRRWYLFVVGIVLAVGLAPKLGKRFGKETYQVGTILMMLKDTVKLRENGEVSTRRLVVC